MGEWKNKHIKSIREKKRRQKNLGMALVLCAAIVSGAVGWKLILPAIAMTQQDMVCGKSEHTHSSECYDQEGNLICGKEEHVHNETCYADDQADLETSDMWEASFKGVNFTGIWNEDLVALAKSQLGYTESSKNYRLSEDGTNEHKGYNRYGAFIGSPYSDWNAAFAEFCLHYAQVDPAKFPGTFKDSIDLIQQLQKNGSYKEIAPIEMPSASMETNGTAPAEQEDASAAGSTEAIAETASEAANETAAEAAAETAAEAIAETAGETTAAETAAETIAETVSETTAETVGETAAAATAEAMTEAAAETTAETTVEITAETAGETIAEIAAESMAETAAEGTVPVQQADAAGPEIGNLVFLRNQDETKAPRIGIVTGQIEKNGRMLMTVVEGDSDNSVKENEYDLNAPEILGYGLLKEAYIAYCEEQAAAAAETASAEENASSEAIAEESIAAGETVPAEAENTDPAAMGAAETEDENILFNQCVSGEDYSVSVSYRAAAGLQDTVLDVREILPGTDEYKILYQDTLYKLVADGQAEDISQLDISGTRFFDIRFLKDGEEIEPAESVQVNITYTEAVVAEDYKVIHFNDDKSADLIEHETAAEEGEEGVKDFQFEGDSFSTYGTVTVNDKGVTQMDEAHQYVNSEFYKPGPLGIIGGFHLVGFDSVHTETHTNGNILTDKLYYNSNFGTNNLREVSYIRHIEPRGNFIMGSQDNCVVVVGKEISVTLQDNGNAWALNGGKLDKPSKQNGGGLWQDTDTCQFIDLEKVKNESAALNQTLRGYSTNLNTPITKNGDQWYINLSGSNNEVNVMNFRADDLSGLTGASLKIQGYDEANPKSLVLNVDLKGKSDFDFNSILCYGNDKNGQNNTEKTVWEAGNLVWNFYDSSESDGLYRGKLHNSRRAFGIILAPEANVYLNQNMDGSVIAKNIYVKAESHRMDFTGPTIIPYSVTVGKEWKGDDSEWISNRPQSVTIRLYKVSTTDSSNKTQVGEAQLSKANDWHYTWENMPKEDGYKYIVEEVNCPAGYNSSVSENSGSKNNSFTVTNTWTKPKFTEVVVQKNWLKSDGSNMSDSEKNEMQPVTIGLYRKKFQGNTQIGTEEKVGEITLSSSNGWSCRWEKLVSEEKIGNTTYSYTYDVKEENASNSFEVSYAPSSTTNNGVTTVTFTVTNKLKNQSYELPETGGIGIAGYKAGGMVLMMASAALLYGHSQRSKRERRHR